MPTQCREILRSGKRSVSGSGRGSPGTAQSADHPLEVIADHVKLYKRALVEAGMTPATVARRLSVLRGTYKQLAAKGLVSWGAAPGHRWPEGV